MHKISGNNAFFYKKVVPAVWLFIIVLWLILTLLSGFLFLLLIPLYFLLIALLAGVFNYPRKMCDVFMDDEMKQFVIANNRQQYIYSYSELRKVKAYFFINVIKLRFDDGSVYFSPQGLDLLPFLDRRVARRLKLITRENQLL